MLKQITRFALVCAFILSALFSIWNFSRTPFSTWKKGCGYFYAKTLHFINPTAKIQSEKRTLSAKSVMKKYFSEGKELKKVFLSTLQKDLIFFPTTFFLLLFYFWRKGKKDRINQHISGQEILPVKSLAKLLRKKGEASDIHLGKLPIVKDSETQHFLITGTTGSGKTNCFHHLLPQIRDKKHKAIIIDSTGTFVQSYFQEGRDILLNPFDSRTIPWHPWAECVEPYHYKEVAKSLIPQTSHDPFWSISAQTIFSILLEHLDAEGERSIQKLLKLMLEEPLEDLFDELHRKKHLGIRALSLLDPKSEKTATSIRSSAASYVDCLSHLPDAPNSFSIRKWLQDDSKSQWLFLTMTPEQRDTLRPLISMWASLAIKSLLGKTPDQSSRTWFVFDELASLHQLNELNTCLAESRKYGGAVILGLQNLSQIDELYGPNYSKAIVDLCSTKISFRQTSPELAHRVAKAFGEREVTEIQEGISYGANDIRDGVNLSMVNKEKLTVSPTEIYTLENLEAYVKLAGIYPATKMKFKYLKQEIISLPFLKRM